jgi:septum formation protein
MKASGPIEQIHLILGSASPRRRDLLSSIGLRFSVEPAQITEDYQQGEKPHDHVCRLALVKTGEVSNRFSSEWVLGADTVVVLDGDILGKPGSVEEAKCMLNRLSDRIHEVYTGYALINHSMPSPARVRWVRSRVKIRGLSESEIDYYVATGEPMDKAGSYAVQGVGAAIVEFIEGSYSNVVGLPLCEVALDLKDLKIFDFLSGPSK